MNILAIHFTISLTYQAMLLLRDHYCLSYLITKLLHLLAACMSNYLFAVWNFIHKSLIYHGLLVAFFIIDSRARFIENLIYWSTMFRAFALVMACLWPTAPINFIYPPGLYGLIQYSQSLPISLILQIYIYNWVISPPQGLCLSTLWSPRCLALSCSLKRMLIMCLRDESLFLLRESLFIMLWEADAYYILRWILAFRAPREGCLFVMLREEDVSYVREWTFVFSHIPSRTLTIFVYSERGLFIYYVPRSGPSFTMFNKTSPYLLCSLIDFYVLCDDALISYVRETIFVCYTPEAEAYFLWPWKGPYLLSWSSKKVFIHWAPQGRCLFLTSLEAGAYLLCSTKYVALSHTL